MYPVLRIGLASRYGKLSAAGTCTSGKRHNDTPSGVEDITLMTASRSPSFLISAFHVACTSAAPRTITNTSADMEHLQRAAWPPSVRGHAAVDHKLAAGDP